MRRLIGLSLAVSGILAFSSPSQATVAVIYDTLSAGVADFDAKVVAAGGTVSTDVWSEVDLALPALRGAYDVAYTNGQLRSSDDLRSEVSYIDMTGRVMLVQPNQVDRSTPLGSINSGITFTFADPINAFGLEVGGFGQCCAPSGLYVSFDGGDPIRLAFNETIGLETFAFDAPVSMFAGAVSDLDQFTTVNFWGDGLNDLFYVGGTIRFGTLDMEDNGTPSPVPLPASVWLLGAVVGGFTGLHRFRPKNNSLAR